MTITNYTFTPFGAFTVTDVTSDLGGSPTFFWYLDGTYYDRTDAPQLTVRLSPGDQAEIIAVDTLSPDSFDVVANAPSSHPARKTFWWTRSVDADVSHYVIKQQREAEGLVEIGNIPATDAWSYRFISPRLDDLTNYDWEILAVDEAGNEGAALVFPQELIVRKPDAPDFTISYTSGTQRAEYIAA